MLTSDQKSELEEMIDRTSVAAVIAALAEICREKGEHIRVNWQDRATAAPWDRKAVKLEKAAKSLEMEW